MLEGNPLQPSATRDAALVTAILPFVRAANRRHLRRRVDGLENLGRGPVLPASDPDAGVAGPDLYCTLGSLWDVLGPEAPFYGLARDFAKRQILSWGAVLARFGGIHEASRPRHSRLEP